MLNYKLFPLHPVFIEYDPRQICREFWEVFGCAKSIYSVIFNYHLSINSEDHHYTLNRN